jgi:hypothetical protein
MCLRFKKKFEICAEMVGSYRLGRTLEKCVEFNIRITFIAGRHLATSYRASGLSTNATYYLQAGLIGKGDMLMVEKRNHLK